MGYGTPTFVEDPETQPPVRPGGYQAYLAAAIAAAGATMGAVLARSFSGEGQHVDAVDAATTDPIDATGVLNRSAFTTNAYVADPLVQVVHPQSVRVIITVGKSISN